MSVSRHGGHPLCIANTPNRFGGGADGAVILCSVPPSIPNPRGSRSSCEPSPIGAGRSPRPSAGVASRMDLIVPLQTGVADTMPSWFRRGGSAPHDGGLRWCEKPSSASPEAASDAHFDVRAAMKPALRVRDTRAVGSAPVLGACLGVQSQSFVVAALSRVASIRRETA
jgi:hypothetical protein